MTVEEELKKKARTIHCCPNCNCVDVKNDSENPSIIFICKACGTHFEEDEPYVLLSDAEEAVLKAREGLVKEQNESYFAKLQDSFDKSDYVQGVIKEKIDKAVLKAREEEREKIRKAIVQDNDLTDSIWLPDLIEQIKHNARKEGEWLSQQSYHCDVCSKNIKGKEQLRFRKLCHECFRKTIKEFVDFAVLERTKKIFEELERHENVTTDSSGTRPMQTALISLNRNTYFELKDGFLSSEKLGKKKEAKR